MRGEDVKDPAIEVVVDDLKCGRISKTSADWPGFLTLFQHFAFVGCETLI